MYVWVIEDVFCGWSEFFLCVIIFVTCIDVVMIYFLLVSMFLVILEFEIYIIL